MILVATALKVQNFFLIQYSRSKERKQYRGFEFPLNCKGISKEFKKFSNTIMAEDGQQCIILVMQRYL